MSQAEVHMSQAGEKNIAEVFWLSIFTHVLACMYRSSCTEQEKDK